MARRLRLAIASFRKGRGKGGAAASPGAAPSGIVRPDPLTVRAAASPPADSGFAALKRQVIGRTGHHYYEDKDALLWERVLRRMHATGDSSSEAYLRRLQSGPDGEREWLALEAAITIGETFFFRYAEQFAALRDTILPGLIARNAASRRLRIWSAGCATGAEAYSVAILLHRLLGDRLVDWSVSILGTDINEDFLRLARAGRFGDWALRTLPEEERRRDFTPAADGRSWQLRPQFRAMVRFERGNLLNLLEPAPPLHLNGFDLILCRNVLIYFRHDVVTGIVRALGERLTPQGWMLLGHAEPNLAFSEFLRVEALPGTVAYRAVGAGQVASDGGQPFGAAVPGAATPPALPWPTLSWPVPPAGTTPAGLPKGAESSARSPAARTAAAPPGAPALSGGGAGAGRASGSGASGDGARGNGTGENGTGGNGISGERSSGSIAAGRGAADAPPGGDALARVRGLADRGALREARQACEAGLADAPDCAALHYYDAMTSWGLSEEGRAEEGFRRVLYLDRNFAVAQYQLGLLLLARGEAEAGRRRISGAARIVRALPPATILAEGDGMTAAELLATAQLHLGGMAGDGGAGDVAPAGTNGPAAVPRRPSSPPKGR